MKIINLDNKIYILREIYNYDYNDFLELYDNYICKETFIEEFVKQKYKLFYDCLLLKIACIFFNRQKFLINKKFIPNKLINLFTKNISIIDNEIFEFRNINSDDYFDVLVY